MDKIKKGHMKGFSPKIDLRQRLFKDPSQLSEIVKMILLNAIFLAIVSSKSCYDS